MTPIPIDSLDPVEMVMAIEKFFGIEIRDSDAEQFGSSWEIVDSLERSLSNSRPNQQAKTLLRKLAKTQDRPELAENLDGTWRREQIAAIIREFFR
jgi:hypothetical protein